MELYGTWFVVLKAPPPPKKKNETKKKQTFAKLNNDPNNYLVTQDNPQIVRPIIIHLLMDKRLAELT